MHCMFGAAEGRRLAIGTFGPAHANIMGLVENQECIQYVRVPYSICTPKARQEHG